MDVVLLESKNIEGEILRLSKDIDQGKYSILRGKYGGQEEGRFKIKGTYDSLSDAFGVYSGVLRNFVKDYH